MSDTDRFERAIDKLMDDRSPRSEVVFLTDDECRMVQMAQLLRGSSSQEMTPEFAERLHARLVTRPRVTRRGALLSGLGALAAGVVAGVGLDRAAQAPPTKEVPPLVGATGRWYSVATLADLTEGTIRPFTAGAVQGFLIYRNGQLRALSRICTHMGCALQIDRSDQAFECPCHGAEFDLHGRFRNSPEYGQPLPPLPPIMTRVRGQTVEVLGA